MPIAKYLLLILGILVDISLGNVSGVDFTANLVVPGSYAHANTAGLSMYLNQTLPYLNNTLFKNYIFNSALYDNYDNVFYQSFHVPVGYKYNCSTALFTNSTNLSCTVDLSTNNYSSIIHKYFYDVTAYYSVDIGWDLQKANFSNTAYYKNFAKYMNFFYSDSVNLQLLDQGNFASSYLNRTYNITTYMADMATISNKLSGIWINGPGITETADSSWVAQIQNLYNNYYTTFTFRCLLFKNTTEATIQNLLSENYSRGYLLRRIVSSTGVPINMDAIDVGVNEIRLIDGVGIDGVTNSFAAALWALDITVQTSILYGWFINFYNPLGTSFQSVLGEAPYFNPKSIYYGLLFADYALRDYPDFQLPQVVAGLSSSIKVIGFDLYSSYRILIINKDINQSLKGTVDIKLAFRQGLSCIYLQAPFLNSTSNITLGGIYFTSNNSQYQGNFTSFNYDIDPSTGLYKINITYAQAIICQTISSPSYYKFKRGKSTHNWQTHLLLCVLMLLVLMG